MCTNPGNKSIDVQCLGTVTQLMWVQQTELGFNYFDVQAFVHLLPSLLSLLKREEILGTLGTSHCSERGTKRCYIPDVLWREPGWRYDLIEFYFYPFFFSSCSGPDFFHPWTDESEEWREKGWGCFWRLSKLLLDLFFPVRCVECGSAVISGNCANPCICALGTSGIATATTSESSQVEISHIWEPQTCWTASKFIWEEFLHSWRKHIQENQTHGRLPTHQQSLLAKVLESVMGEHGNIPVW